MAAVWGQEQPAATAAKGQVSTVPRLKSRITIAAHKGPCWFAIYSPDGKTLATGGAETAASDDGKTAATWSVRLWERTKGNPKATLTGHTSPSSAAFSPDGKTLASGASNGEMIVWDPVTKTRTAKLTGHTKAVRGVAFAPDGKTLASCSDDHTIRIWDTESWRDRSRLPETDDAGQGSFAIALDGKTLATAAAANSPSEITFWEAGSDRVRQIIKASAFF